MLVAIDGPAGAGKSTVARATAQALGYTYLDTGAMYRAAALALQRDPQTDLAALDLEVGERVLLGGEDVSDAIREPQVAEAASRAAADPEVRRALVSRQQALLADGNWVAEGRDIGTVVAPHAQLKLFLTASAQERARRRAQQTGRDERDVLAEQAQRDSRDERRAASPLHAADDAVTVDTTGLTLAEVVDRILALVGERSTIPSGDTP